MTATPELLSDNSSGVGEATAAVDAVDAADSPSDSFQFYAQVRIRNQKSESESNGGFVFIISCLILPQLCPTSGWVDVTKHGMTNTKPYDTFHNPGHNCQHGYFDCFSVMDDVYHWSTIKSRESL